MSPLAIHQNIEAACQKTMKVNADIVHQSAKGIEQHGIAATLEQIDEYVDGCTHRLRDVLELIPETHKQAFSEALQSLQDTAGMNIDFQGEITGTLIAKGVNENDANAIAIRLAPNAKYIAETRRALAKIRLWSEEPPVDALPGTTVWHPPSADISASASEAAAPTPPSGEPDPDADTIIHSPDPLRMGAGAKAAFHRQSGK